MPRLVTATVRFALRIVTAVVTSSKVASRLSSQPVRDSGLPARMAHLIPGRVRVRGRWGTGAG